MLVLLVFLFLFLILLVLLGLDTCPLLHFPQTQEVGHESLVCSLLLLLDSEQRVITNLRGRIASSVRILSGNEVLVGRANL